MRFDESIYYNEQDRLTLIRLHLDSTLVCYEHTVYHRLTLILVGVSTLDAGNVYAIWLEGKSCALTNRGTFR